jgi:hypothetical protein
MNRAPTSDRGGSGACCSRFSVGASAPIGAAALHFNTATDRPRITTECHQVVGDALLLPVRRQK